jgi:transposase-like protein
VKGQWYYRHRAVDNAGQTIDVLLTAQRDERPELFLLLQHGLREALRDREL